MSDTRDPLEKAVEAAVAREAIRKLEAEIERLRADLSGRDADAERFHTKWTKAETEIERLRAAADAYDALIKRAQTILTVFLTPDGNDAEVACQELLELLDGPPWRDARDKYSRALEQK